MQSKMQIGAFVFTVLLAVFGHVPYVAADQQLRQRIETIERQEMLAYRMTKSACLVMLGANAQIFADVTLQTAQEFQREMEALLNGDDARGLAPETDPALRKSLEETRKYSRGLTASAAQIASGDLHSVPVRLLIARNRPVAEQLKALVQKTKDHYPQSTQEAGLINAVDLAHAQNALAQELLRDLCYLSLDLSGASTRDALLVKIKRFEETTQLLIKGDPTRHIPKAPNIHIKMELTKVAKTWKTMRGFLDGAAAGDPVSLKHIQVASVMGDSIFSSFAKILERYGKL